ncbi:hypothetical protein FO519_005998 [Halicephalobus sp. NKZ332]|nr:hypothetical protein FO519_005998 [Halicephalobus sp. NKZ332]
MAPSPANSAQAKRRNFAAKGSSKTPSIEDESFSVPPVSSDPTKPTDSTNPAESIDLADPVDHLDPTDLTDTSSNSAPPTLSGHSSSPGHPGPPGRLALQNSLGSSDPSAPRRHSHNVQSSKFSEKRRVSQRPFAERRRTSVIVGQRSVDLMAETHPTEKSPKFVTFIIKLYKRWGYFIADHDWQAIVICLIISILANVVVFITPQQNDVTGYSPYGARARIEHSRYQEFFAHDGLGLYVYIFATAKDSGTMLRTGHLKEVVDTGLNGTNELDSEDMKAINGMGSENLKEHVTNMKSVKMVVLQFRAEHELGWEDKDVKEYEMSIVQYFKNSYKSDNLKLYVLTQSYIEEEMVHAGSSLVPYFSVGFLIMCACACISVMLRAMYLHQHSFPKIILAVAACVLPFMSCATALALMFLCKMRFASILCVIPFLVLAIGVDSSYLMIHEWQRVIQQCRMYPNRRNSQIGYRIAEVLSEVGPAILISALTNILADGVGSFTSSPEITLLCVGNLISMFVAFIYQMTCYTGLMSLIGRYEIKVEREERNKAEHSLRDKKISITKHNQLTRQQSKFHEETKEAISKTMRVYVSIIANKFVATVVIFAYFFYLGFSIYGITKIDINLSTQKLFAQDSPLLELDKLRVEYQVPHYTMATIFVNNPGNFSDVNRMKKMNKFVEDMEAINGSWGPVGTKYFIRDFLEFENSVEDAGEFEEPPEEPLEDGSTPDPNSNSNSSILSEEAKVAQKENELAHLYSDADLPGFIAWPEYSFWNGFIRINNDTKLEKFFFTTAYHGKQLSIWTERGNLLNKWRDTVDRYANEFDASVFHEDGVFLDLIENMPSDTWQSVLGAVACMGIVCYIFLNSWFAVIIATTAVLSICTGILGLISWWGIDLDPISMAAMIICVGSSCDLPAHTSFHYYLATVRRKDANPEEKLGHCLSTIAFPAIQAAVSMVLCVSSLLFVHLYMSTVFVKTMTLCVILCNLHALVFIPAFLVMWDYIGSHFNGFKKNNKVNPDDDLEPGSKSSRSPSISSHTMNGKRTASPNHASGI